jgi:hypothetical protein
MINSDIKVEKKESQEFTPLPENIYQVELLDVTDEKRPTYDTRNNPDSEKKYETVFNFQFVLLAGKDKDGEPARGRNLWANFIPSYLYESKKGKNKLYQITEALLGHNLTLEEEAKMDGEFINNLIGKQIRVGTANKANGDKVFTNIDVYYPIEMEMPSLTAEEKEKATVKEKGESEESETKHSDEISIDDIPWDSKS